MTPPVVSVERGRVDYSGRPVLRDLDLTVLHGEVVALLGENGSGKSTFIRAALGLTPLTSGAVRLFDTPLASFRQWERVGYVPQRSTAATGVPATVREVVSSGRLARRRPLLPMSREDRAAVDSALEAVGLSDRARDPLSTLSGGQQQRALIARALAGRPDLFVLDEPNAGVDSHNQQALADSLALLVAQGATVLVVLHELGPMAPLIDRSVTLREGRVCADVHHEHSHGSHHHHREDEPGSPVPLQAPWEGR